MAHLIGSLVAAYDTPRGRIGIARIGLGVVIVKAHRNHRARWQKDRSAVAVDCLPVQVPCGNADEPAARAVGKRCESFEQSAEIVGVRVDGEHVDLERQPKIVGDYKVASARGNIQRAIVLELDEYRIRRLRLIGEV